MGGVTANVTGASCNGRSNLALNERGHAPFVADARLRMNIIYRHAPFRAYFMPEGLGCIQTAPGGHLSRYPFNGYQEVRAPCPLV
jgi:hypothetical protein